MENATDALKMAAAMFIFILALSATVFAFTKARQASTGIMSKADSDRTYYVSKYGEPTSTTETVVGVDDVITNLYSYQQTQDTILFYKKDGESINPLILYNTSTSDRRTVYNPVSLLQFSELRDIDYNVPEKKDRNNTNRGIYGIDASDEITRDEPWSRDPSATKQFIDSLINKRLSPMYTWSRLPDGVNKIFTPNVETGQVIQIIFNYELPDSESFIDTKCKFIKRTGEYNQDAIYTKDDSVVGADQGYSYGGQQYDKTNPDKSRIYFDNDEDIENNKGNKKRVIQYVCLPDE